MTRKKLSLQEINAFNQDRFTTELTPLFEGPPWIVTQAWQARPFASRDALYQTLCQIMFQAPREQQERLLNAHPDLVGRAALAGTLSSESTGEQAAAGLNHLSSEEIALFNTLNQQYRQRFAFPFIICARENKKESILAGFQARLPHSRDQEIEMALNEITKICAFRLQDLVSDTPASDISSRE